MITTIILCALASVIVAMGVGAMCKKGGAADESQPTPPSPNQDAAP